MSDEEILTIDDLCALLKVTPAVLYNLNRPNRRAIGASFPFIKIGRGLRARKSSVLQWLAAREQERAL